MAESATLKFNSTGTAVWVVSKNGKESLSEDTKKGAIEMLDDMLRKEHITEQEHEDFTKQVMESKILPDGDDFGVHITVIEISFGTEEGDLKGKEMKKPSFKMCTSCGLPIPHAYFHDDEGKWFGFPVTNKAQAKERVKLLLNEKVISDGEGLKDLLEQINAIDLPEN